jgi:tetratricopeptide (TPR) repeat protein
MLKGNYIDAVVYFEKAFQLQPNFPKAHNNMGLVLMSQKNFIEAATHFRKALRSDPGFKSARDNLEKAIAALNNRPS